MSPKTSQTLSKPFCDTLILLIGEIDTLLLCLSRQILRLFQLHRQFFFWRICWLSVCGLFWSWWRRWGRKMASCGRSLPLIPCRRLPLFRHDDGKRDASQHRSHSVGATPMMARLSRQWWFDGGSDCYNFPGIGNVLGLAMNERLP